MAWAGKDWTDPRIGAWQGCWEWKGNLWYEMRSHFTKRSVRIRSTLRHLKRDQLALTWAEWSNTENAYQPACKFDKEQKWTKVIIKLLSLGLAGISHQKLENCIYLGPLQARNFTPSPACDHFLMVWQSLLLLLEEDCNKCVASYLCNLGEWRNPNVQGRWRCNFFRQSCCLACSR